MKKSLSFAERGFFSKIFLFINLNFYAIVLNIILAGHLAAFFLLPVLHDTWLKCIIQAVIMLFTLQGCVRIYITYPFRKRMYLALLKKNCKNIRLDSFEDFMFVPCHKRVCIEVLRQLDKEELYPELKKRYGNFFTPEEQHGFHKLHMDITEQRKIYAKTLETRQNERSRRNNISSTE